MKSGLTPIMRGLPLAALLLICKPVVAELDLQAIAGLHWHPDTAAEARRLTLAASAWLQSEAEETTRWDDAVRARAALLDRRTAHAGSDWALLGDGVFAWLVQARDHDLSSQSEPFPTPPLKGLDMLAQEPTAGGRIGRLEQVAALDSPSVWQRLERRIAAHDGPDPVPAMASVWSELAERADPEHPAAGHAAELGGLVAELARAQDEQDRTGITNRILWLRALHHWQQGEVLSTVWLAFEALARLASSDLSGDEAREWFEWLDGLERDQVRNLRQVDPDLPVMLALLEDAASYLTPPDRAPLRALNELADVYARLALFVPDMGFYLDQPVRSEIRSTVAACNPDPLLVGPMPREVYERCVRNLFSLLDSGLATEELAGGRDGPFATEFLRRELGLVSWQRAAYLDGHLGWMLDAPCQSPEWVNVLEWSLAIEHLARWVPQRPVFFAGPRWQEALAEVREDAVARSELHQDWMDCISGHGGERRDPVRRLLERHDAALYELEAVLLEASEQFYTDHVRPGADIDLDGPATQVTGYRPEQLVVRPCEQAQTCGARAELPVSRALLGLFPNAYLLADQLGMGDVGLCYEAVRWVDRTTRPARARDRKVANYEGRLSFELHGSFDSGQDEGPETVFRYRLTAADARHYLFAAANPELLELDCPRELIGTSVASTLPEDRPRLIPDRLTYFVSAPTTPEAEMLAHWDRGAEWRDWFVTGDRVEQLEAADGEDIKVLVQARLTALTTRRERQLSAPLTAPVRAGEVEPVAGAMARVADSTAMLRRLMEIHYPRVIRHHDPIRSVLVGDAGLINRDRIRSLRDEGVPMVQVPRIGRERSEVLRDKWQQLPTELREQGQRAPEADYGFERLEALMRISRDLPAVFEPPEAP
jgi:hypothetical protein